MEGKWAEMNREELAKEWLAVEEEITEVEMVPPAATPVAKKEESSELLEER